MPQFGTSNLYNMMTHFRHLFCFWICANLDKSWDTLRDARIQTVNGDTMLSSYRVYKDTGSIRHLMLIRRIAYRFNVHKHREHSDDNLYYIFVKETLRLASMTVGTLYIIIYVHINIYTHI